MRAESSSNGTKVSSMFHYKLLQHWDVKTIYGVNGSKVKPVTL